MRPGPAAAGIPELVAVALRLCEGRLTVAAPKTPERDSAIAVPVFDRRGQSAGSIDVDPGEFGGKVNKQLLHDVVLMYQANRRAGTHSTLRRGEVAGSTKKLFRQKGTGNARVGTRRSNKRKGGGTANGPKPRDYSYSIPKKAIRAATRMALLAKLQDGAVMVVDDLAIKEPKTKEMAGVLKALRLADTTCLIGTSGLQPAVYKSGRNIRGVEVLPAAEFNAYAVLRPKRVLLTKDALGELRQSRRAEGRAS
jgi:large subunit ribosomal protein L4